MGYERMNWTRAKSLVVDSDGVAASRCRRSSAAVKRKTVPTSRESLCWYSDASSFAAARVSARETAILHARGSA